MRDIRTVDLVFLKLKEIFRRNPKTTWGKNELVKQLDDIHDEFMRRMEAEE